MVNSNSRESKLFRKRRADAVQLLTVWVVGVVGLLESGVVGDVGWARVCLHGEGVAELFVGGKWVFLVI